MMYLLAALVAYDLFDLVCAISDETLSMTAVRVAAEERDTSDPHSSPSTLSSGSA